MGLDNGIILTLNHKIDVDSIPYNVNIELDEYGLSDGRHKGFEYDICYWRKCWNIREKIIDILHAPQDGGIYEIDKPDQILLIRDVIANFLAHPETWEEGFGGSIWDIFEIAPSLIQNIFNLNWLYDYMEENKGAKIKVEFYDSY